MKTDRFQLDVIPIENILVHEELDPSNSKELVNFLKKSQTLSNPIIAAALGNKKYVQLLLGSGKLINVGDDERMGLLFFDIFHPLPVPPQP